MILWETEKQKLASRLGDIIAAEVAKPEDDVDYALIAECEKLLDKLVGDKSKLTARQLEENLRTIKAGAGEAPDTARVSARSSGKPVRK